jgi:hypothetical protein
MTRDDMAEVMRTMYEEEHLAREAGQQEYAHDTDNAFGNFQRLATDLKMDQKKVLWIYLRKHLDGILAHINGHKSQREDVRGRIKDARVYLALLRGMIEDEGRGTANLPF